MANIISNEFDMLGKLKEDQCGWSTMWRVVQDVFGVPRWHSVRNLGFQCLPISCAVRPKKKKRERGGWELDNVHFCLP